MPCDHAGQRIAGGGSAVRSRLTRVLPKGMEISHFSVLNNLAWHEGRTHPRSWPRRFIVTRGAMTNTLTKLEWAGYVHIRPDWDDARRKMVAISPQGGRRATCVAGDCAADQEVVDNLGEDQVRRARPSARCAPAGRSEPLGWLEAGGHVIHAQVAVGQAPCP